MRTPLYFIFYIEHRASQHYAHTSCFLGFSLATLSVLAELIGNVFLTSVNTSSVLCSVQCDTILCTASDYRVGALSDPKWAV